MSNPSFYNQTEAVQRTVDQLIRESYMPEIPELLWKVGSPTLRLLKPSEKLAHAANGGIIQRVITNRANSGRATGTLLADFKRGRTSTAARVKLRLDYDTPADNDFISIEASTAIPWHDFVTGGSDAAETVLSRAQDDVFDSLDYTTSVLMHSDATGSIGAINGTKKKEFGSEGTFADASAHAGGDTHASFLVDGHTIGVFKEGVHLDAYTSAGVLTADEMRIDKVNYEENSISVVLSELSTVDNVDDLTDNDVIYLAGTKGAGFKCAFKEMFKADYASDSWVGGIDRSAQGNRHWIPIRTRSGAATMPMTKAFLDNAARAIGYRTSESEQEAPVFLAGAEIIDNFRSDVGDSAIVNEGATDRGSYTIGELALSYQHPVLGRVNLVSDYTAVNDRGYLLFPEDMEMYFAEMMGPVVMSDGTSGKGFERVEGADPNSGGSKFYKLEVMEQKAPFFKRINRAASIANIL